MLLISDSNITSAQDQRPASLERALELYESQNFVAALPLLEQASAEQPNDAFILSRLGFSLYAVSVTEKNADARKKMQERARQVLLKSQSAGDDSNLTQITLEALSHDEVAIPFSQLNTAEAAMRQGEAAFVRGDLDAALGFYKKALELDPKLYGAALYAGDSEFKKAYLSKDPQFRKEHFEQAAIWFAKAITIDPNRETAYRYWGDALDLQGQTNEARDKFVEAIVAEPYNRKPYMGLMQWGERHGISMNHPNIVVPTGVSSPKAGSVTITLDDQALRGDPDGTAAWMMYGITRASWSSIKNGKSEKFARAYPGEPVYRPSLAEEVEALKMVAESASTQLREKPRTNLNPSLVNLIKLKDEGLLEAYVLFVRSNKDIARDYEAYRNSNRDKLRRYWLDVVIAKQ
jgi:tetratricopeptide (TPR) repeat protein